ncbi:aldo/keto reductase [Gracilibacillus alcaliphilus]|uniref:aldo/keto reductase n=1 Tax=Gracilibacillus alcaliphilus TaxID=1401441 RepID=UPI001958AB0F|nr:aldo/keto reductase [Gracilibacillus alcaliphilus]MBM7677391.1 diketogulonate reductase-like aldo/keto reductase [Gracilibacillus alcaliphilus]
MVQLLDKARFPIGMGTWHMGDSPAKWKQEIEALRYGLEHGIEVIDTAEMYGEGNAECLIGEAIQGINREDILLISKFYPNHAAEPDLGHALKQSLKRLGTDYLDMYLLHWRGSIPLQQTISDLEKYVEQGIIRSWGVSNFDMADIQEMWKLEGGKHGAANQVLYNIASRGIEYDLLPLQRSRSLPTIAYSPIAQGDTRGDAVTENPVVQEIAERHGATVFQIMLAWTIRQGDVVSIPQSSNVKHIQENIEAASISFSEEDIRLLDQVFPAPIRKMPLDII